MIPDNIYSFNFKFSLMDFNTSFLWKHYSNTNKTKNPRSTHSHGTGTVLFWYERFQTSETDKSDDSFGLKNVSGTKLYSI